MTDDDVFNPETAAKIVASGALFRTAKAGAEAVPLTMERKDQTWVPTVLYLTGNGEMRIIGLLLHNIDDIINATEVLTRTLREAKAIEAAFVFDAIVRGDCGAELEVVLVAHVLPETARIEGAAVDRNGEKPALGPWAELGVDIDVPQFPLIDAMRAAI